MENNQPTPPTVTLTKTDVENLVNESVKKALEQPFISKLWTWKLPIAGTLVTAYLLKKVLHGKAQLRNAQAADIEKIENSELNIKKKIDNDAKIVTAQNLSVDNIDSHLKKLIFSTNLLGGTAKENLQKLCDQNGELETLIQATLEHIKQKANTQFDMNGAEENDAFESIRKDVENNHLKLKNKYTKIGNKVEKTFTGLEGRCDNLIEQISPSIKLQKLQTLIMNYESLKDQLPDNEQAQKLRVEIETKIRTAAESIENEKQVRPNSPEQRGRRGFSSSRTKLAPLPSVKTTGSLSSKPGDESSTTSNSTVSLDSFALNSNQGSFIGNGQDQSKLD